MQVISERRRHIGSTACAPILGLSPFSSEHDIWRELMGMPKPTRRRPFMIRGNYVEPLLADRVAATLGRELEPIEPVLHPHGVECMRVKGDYRVRGTRTAVELKSSGYHAFMSWGGLLPEYYRIQAVIEAWSFEAPSIIVPVLVVPEALVEAEALLLDVEDQTYIHQVLAVLAPLMVAKGSIQYFHVDADPAYAEGIVSHVSSWWDRHIVGGVEPPVSNTDAFLDYAREAYEKKKPLREATITEAELIKAYDAARAAESKAKEEKELLGAQLRQAIGDAEGLEIPGVGYAKATAGEPRTPWKELAIERGARLQLLGEVLDDVVKKVDPNEKPTRTLNVRLTGKKKS